MSLFGPTFIKKSKRSPEGLGAAAVALPKVAALDYRTSAASWDAAARTLHSNYPISIFGMLPSSVDSAADSGYQLIQNLKADRSDKEIYQYMIFSQANSELTHAPTYAPIYGPINTNNWWARDVGSGNRTRTGQITAFPALEVNLCDAYTTADGTTGLKAAASIAEGYKTFILDYMVAISGAPIDGVFIDNFWINAGGFTSGATVQVNSSNVATAMSPSTAIGAYNGGANNTRQNSWANRNAIPNQEWRKGMALGVNQLRTNRGGQTGYANFKIMVNGDGDFTDDATWGNACVATTELTGLVDYNYLEGITSTVGTGSSNGMGVDGSCPAAYRGQFKDVLNRIYSAKDNVRRDAILGAYIGTSDEDGRTRQKCRMAIGTALLADCYVSVGTRTNLSSPSSAQPYLYDEMTVPVGVPVDARPTADNVGSTGYDGMYKREYSSALVIVNPSSNKGRWLQNAGGTCTIDRTSNTVTFVWSAMPDAMWNAITAGTTKIRLQDLSATANLTLNGVFTIATKALNGSGFRTLTWSQTGANVASASKPNGYVGIQTTVNLTGGGWKRITGTDSGSVALYNGTPGTNVNSTKSQNDGTLVTTLSLWPNDAIILIKQ